MEHIAPHIGVVVVDHGSKRPAANEMLVEMCRIYAEATGAAIVEPAHMEIAEPTIAQAFERCVGRGARAVVVLPYFLSPGRHSMRDIPRLTEEAAAAHPDIPCRIAEPFGIDDRLAAVMHRRVLESLRAANRST
ncbi:MAG: CbiX/SirB N-terminal domain-containing protein [Candidatus Hydrogenedentota bacterium]